MASDLKRAGLHRVNISLDSLVAGAYAAITRGGDLQRVLAGIEAALRTGLTPVKLNAVVLRGYNDGELVNLARFAFERGCAMRFIELMPIGCAEEIFPDHFVPASEVRARLEKPFRLEPIAGAPGHSSRDFHALAKGGLRGVVGFISPETQPFCDGCRRLRLTSTGCLISCLARRDGLNIRSLLRSDSPADAGELVSLAAEALAEKQTYHSHSLNCKIGRPMVKVGG